ncbi:MAG: HRDC domain-containing protein [Wenzhouxiangellaceae bacterium]|nr:HRDC domain-containing protein [Wenzhouxiangellaceae bacterium]
MSAGEADSEVRIVEDERGLEDFRAAVADARRLAIDTEFVRERTFYPVPGLVQIGDGERAWLLDPVVLGTDGALSEALADLLADARVEKIMHSVGEDLEVLDLICGQLPDPLFDTQIAAAMLGWPLQLRYETLVGDVLGLDLPGGLGRNDWTRRPLPSEWVRYAAHDVIALPALRDALAERLDDAGRLDWLREDCRRLVETGRSVPDALVRIKGAAGLDDAALARLERMAEWRDEQARTRDLPRGFVVPDAALLAIARSAPATVDELAAVDGLKPGVAKRFGRALLSSAESAASAALERPPELHPLTGEQKARIRELQNRVRNVADDLGIEPPLIASRRDLTRLVQRGRAEWLAGWRADVLGRDFAG